ncbi:hypothetical protein BN946_scf184569.g51 [Trametes cinnabarina]|uniref:Diacylglycerol O-acyltransferase n=1 Tax=Pycnoporus cinnabarinus TaxID=5643 RepID=A0A060SDM7_PYCCI|nr:hypothetical protein BN946_scf184569.g51 [Trametes cinnabarina]
MSATPQVIRPAGVLEAFFYTRTQLGVDSCVAATANYMHIGGRPLDKPTLFTALEEVIAKHPIMGTRLYGTATSRVPSWVRLDSIDLNRIVQFRDDLDPAQLESILEDVFLQPFDLDADLPLWRLMILPGGQLIYANDHAMGDGLSGLSALFTLLAALQKVPENPTHSGIISLSDRQISLLPPLEEALTIPVPLSMIFKEVNQSLNPFASRKRNSIWTGNTVARAYKLGVNVRIIRINPEEMNYLVKMCRTNGTTLTGVLFVLAVNSMVMFVPLPLRAQAKTPLNAICNHVSYYSDVHPFIAPALDRKTPYPAADRFPWKEAARFSETLQREAPEAPATIGVMRALITSRENYFQGLLGKKREGTVEISNVGPVSSAWGVRRQPTPEEPWTMPDLLICQADGTAGAALKVNVTGTVPGGLGITLTWGKDAMDEAFANQWVEAIRDGLKSLVSTTSPSSVRLQSHL